jgi:hypothetical protein
MERYDHLHSLLLSSRARQAGAGALVDEDGFTVVIRGGRYGRTGGRGDGEGKMGVGVARRGFEKEVAAGKKKGKGAGELVDFYKFQHVDRKRQGGSETASFYHPRRDSLRKRLLLTPRRVGGPSGQVRGRQEEGGGDEKNQAVQAVLSFCSVSHLCFTS